MKFNRMPSQQYLKQCLRYERRTGKLFWKIRPKNHFPSAGHWKTWNARWSKKAAFTTSQITGHLVGTINWKHYFAHRIIWKLVTGKEPREIIDHKDRDATNNRWGNLRPATKSQNGFNSHVKKGVYFDKNRGKWAAEIKLRGKKKHLGRHDTLEEARFARAAAGRELFGEFAP